MGVGEVINTAETAWKIIQSGAPSAEINSATANAVPDVDDWQNLTGARGPIKIAMSRENRVGWPFDNYVNVDIMIVLKFEYGATYRGGGLFVPNIYIEVPECFVGWSYDVEADIHVRNPTNANTPKAPIARVPVSISSTISNPFWSSRAEWGFLLYGDGRWEQT